MTATNRDKGLRIAKQWQEFELCFPGRICCDEIVEVDVYDLDWSEPAARTLCSVLAVYFAEQCVGGSGERVVAWMRVTDQQQFVMRWL